MKLKWDMPMKIKPIKILFLAANPEGTNRLQLDEEVRAITEKVRASKHRALIKLITCWAVRTDDLIQALNEYQPQIVQFSGHGSRKGEIILVDKHGGSRPVGSVAMRELFELFKENNRVVIFK
jgi:hypothetical protein